MLLDEFTERENEIVNLMLEGMSNREIAENLTVSVETVRWYCKQIYSKLNVHSREEAIEAARAYFSRTEHETKAITVRLPIQTTRFLGREEAMRDLRDLLAQSEQRLVSIIAPGGMGKSRLSIELGRKMAAQYPDGVYFVELAPLNERETIIKEIATRLDFPFQQGEGQEEQKLLRYLGNKCLLLILDNFGHLLNHSDIVAEILKIAPQVNLIVTSRERLNISDETVYTLNGISVPDDNGTNLADYPAVQIFLDSARRVRPDYEADNSALSAIAHICQMVEGMPLALLLAGAWVELLSPEQIRDEIQANLDFLESDARDIPERQRSIRAVFDYTWQRMSEDEQNAFMRLSLFRGGFTAESAQKVASASLRTLLRLMNRALIQHAEHERYTIHELLRQYGEERLRDSAEFESTQEQFINYFADFLHTRENDVRSHRQLEALDEIGRDLSNIQQAWLWMIARKDYEALDRSLDCFFTYSIYREHYEIDEYLSEARLQLAPASDKDANPLYGRLLVYGYKLESSSLENIERALAIAEQHNRQSDTAYAIYRKGIYWRNHPQQGSSIDYFIQAELLYESLNNPYMQASCLYNLAFAHILTGNDFEAQKLIERSYTLYREIGNQLSAARVVMISANLDWRMGYYERAIQFYEQAIALQSNLHTTLAIRFYQKFFLFEIFGELDFAQFHDILKQASEVQYEPLVSLCLGALCYEAIFSGDFEEGKRYLEENKRVRIYAPIAEPIYRGQAALYVAMGDYQEAKKLLITTMKADIKRKRVTTLIQYFPLIVLCLVADEHYEQAVELVAIVTEHFREYSPWYEQWSVWQETVAGLKDALDEDAYQAAWQRGLEADVQTLAQELLSGYLSA